MRENVTSNLEKIFNQPSSSAESITTTMFGIAVPSNHSFLYPLSSSSPPLFSGISGGGVCSVAANQRLVISWVLLIFFNRIREQGGSILPSNFFTEVLILILYFWRKISSLASSTFVHFFLPYINYVHSLNRTIIGAVIVELTPIS